MIWDSWQANVCNFFIPDIPERNLPGGEKETLPRKTIYKSGITTRGVSDAVGGDLDFCRTRRCSG